MRVLFRHYKHISCIDLNIRAYIFRMCVCVISVCVQIAFHSLSLSIHFFTFFIQLFRIFLYRFPLFLVFLKLCCCQFCWFPSMCNIFVSLSFLVQLLLLILFFCALAFYHAASPTKTIKLTRAKTWQSNEIKEMLGRKKTNKKLVTHF